MNTLVEKLRKLEQEISAEKGPFVLFALFLRENAPNVWDLLVAAPWIEVDQGAALRYLSAKLTAVARIDELIKLARIELIEQSNPGLAALQSAIQVEHGLTEFRDSNFFGLDIKHAYVITSRHPDAQLVEAH